MKELWNGFRVFIALTLLTGVVYPLAVTGAAQLFFNDKANGSLLEKDGRLAGSALVGQRFDQDGYFWSRPSAGEYESAPSSASNLTPVGQAVREQMEINRAKYAEGGQAAADEMLFTSASGLDPHISPRAAQVQTARVARARGLEQAAVALLVEQFTQARDFGFLGEPRVNVLQLNLALDQTARPE